MISNKQFLQELEEKHSFLKEYGKKAREAIPEQFRTTVRNLYNNPMGLYICRSLYRTKINSKFGYSRVVKAAARAPNADVSKLPQLLEDMKAKDIICIEQRYGKSDYALTPVSVEAVKIINTIEKKAVRPISRLLSKDIPELKEIPREESEKVVRSLIYAALA